jgi:hypothetical protein
MDSTFILQVLSLIAGIICIVLGVFVFFRRAGWRNQEKRGSGLLGLDLNRSRNNLAPITYLRMRAQTSSGEPTLDKD